MAQQLKQIPSGHLRRVKAPQTHPTLRSATTTTQPQMTHRGPPPADLCAVTLTCPVRGIATRDTLSAQVAYTLARRAQWPAGHQIHRARLDVRSRLPTRQHATWIRSQTGRLSAWMDAHTHLRTFQRVAWEQAALQTTALQAVYSCQKSLPFATRT